MATLNWEQLYAAENISKKWRLPDTQMTDTGEGAFRDLFLNWGSLPKKTETGNDIPNWFIYCDVLRIEKDQVLDVSSFIFARRIEIAPGKTIILDNQEEQSVELFLFTQEVVDTTTGDAVELSIFNLTDAGESQFQFAPPAGQDIAGLSWDGQEEAPLPLTADDLEGFFNFDSPLVLLLNSQFQVSALLSSDNIPASIAIMRWVAGITKSPHADQEIAGQAQSMLLNLISNASITEAGTILVPKLDHTIYANKAKALADMLELHETQWDKLLDRGQDIQQWLADAQVVFAEKDEQLALADNLTKQAEETWRSAQDARSIAAAQIVTLLGEMDTLRINFSAGIQAWKHKNILSDSAQLVLGTAEILVEIPVIIEAAPGLLVPEEAFTSISENLIAESRARDAITNNLLVGAGPRSDVAGMLEAKRAKSNDAWKNLKKSGKKIVSAGQSAGSGAQRVMDAGLNIVNTIERAHQLEDTSEQILINTFSTANKAFSTIELQGLDVVTGGSQVWDEASIDIEATFSQIVELQEINGGNEFLVGLRKLILYGKTYSQARLAAAKANAYFAEMRMKQASAKKVADLFAKRIGQLQQQSNQIQVLSQRLFTKMISDKRAVYLALESYNRALRYFTLSDGIQLPSMTDSYPNFRKTISAVIAGDQIVATKLDAPPQTMNQMTFEVADENILASIREYGFANWNLPLNSEAFRHFGRVRLGEIRVFLQGVNSSNPIQVLIMTSGVYYDKDTIKETASYRFVAEPLGMRFVYHNDTINIQADIAERFKDNYFHPTPFTNWSFHFSSEEATDKLDFSTLSGLKIEFKGEVTSIL